MKRTLFTDGVEVDESDLDNTENTKIAEILARSQLDRFGVIEGLSLTIFNNTVSVGVGKATFANGELIELTTPLNNIVGASFDAARTSFFGLRLTETTSNPKPHEVDPVTFDTRAEPKIVGEFFVAGDTTTESREAARTAAINAQIVDQNFLFLGEFEGTGTGFVLRQNSPLPRTRGGDQPLAGETPKTNEQKNRLQEIYEGTANDNFPIRSAKDDFHRSLIGTGQPTSNNPHGLTLEDLGGDRNIQEHLVGEHVNGLIGFEPSDDDYTPTSGSFAFTTADAPTNSVQIGPIAASETLLIRGTKFGSSAIGTTTISFVGKASGLYYIVAKFGSDSADLTIEAVAKATFEALLPLNNGAASWLNSALEISAVSGDLENKFYAIGMVFWNGSNQFRQLADAININIPASSPFLTLTAAVTDPIFFIPPTKKTLDLRRYGTITNEVIQKRTIRIDRLTPPVTSLALFASHAGATSLSLSGTAGQRAAAIASVQSGNIYGGDQTILKHLTDFDANNLFGHRGTRGSVQHGAAINDMSPNAAPTNKPQNYGFQTNIDKWKQDNLTMTIFKWSDLNQVQGDKTMGDAVTSSTGDTIKAARYPLARTGYFSNFLARLGDKLNTGTMTINFVVNDTVVPLITFTSSDPDGTIKGAAGPIAVGGTFAAPFTIAIRRNASSNTSKNLCVTAEFHYES